MSRNNEFLIIVLTFVLFIAVMLTTTVFSFLCWNTAVEILN